MKYMSILLYIDAQKNRHLFVTRKMDISVYYNGIAVSNLVDGGVFFDGGGAENTTFTYPTRTNYIRGGVFKPIYKVGGYFIPRGIIPGGINHLQ